MQNQPAKIPTAAVVTFEACVVVLPVAAFLLRRLPIVPGVLAAASTLAYFALVVLVPAAIYSMATDRTARSAGHVSAVAAGAVLVLGLFVAPFLAGGV